LFEELVAESPGEPGYLSNLAEAYRARGVALLRLGRNREAEKPFHRAVDLLTHLVATFPDSPDLAYHRKLARGHEAIAHTWRGTGRHQEEERAHRQALKIREQVATRLPDRLAARSDLSLSHFHLGGVLVLLERLPEAEQALRQAVAIQEELVARD